MSHAMSRKGNKVLTSPVNPDRDPRPPILAEEIVLDGSHCEGVLGGERSRRARLVFRRRKS